MKTIPLTQGKVALVDDVDFAFLSQWKWCANKSSHTWYAYRTDYTSGTRTTVFMHRLILSVTDPSVHVDHKDHNGINNQRYNLRVATPQQNQGNSKKQAGCSSQYKGVCWNRRDKKWQAQARFNRKTIALGCYDTEEEAAEAYNTAAQQLFGEFAVLNLPQHHDRRI